MRGQRGRLSPPSGREFNKDCVCYPARNFSEGIAVKKEKGRGSVALQQEIKSFSKTQFSLAIFFPSSPHSFMSF